jgi:hypothetical protein
MSYYFEEQQHLMFEVYDLDSNSIRLADHDFIGRCRCTLGQIVSGGKLVLDLVNPEHASSKFNPVLWTKSRDSLIRSTHRVSFIR